MNVKYVIPNICENRYYNNNICITIAVTKLIKIYLDKIFFFFFFFLIVHIK